MEKYITSNLKTELGYFTLKSIKKKITYFYPSNDKSEKINNNHLQVWNEISKIKYGQTITYNDIAKKLSSSPRAIGNACSKNKCLFLIPCHRIICANGSTGGYVLGENIKEYLIKLEKNAK